MIDRQQDGAALFELVFRPNVRLVSLVRRFVSEFYCEILEEPDAVSRLALATHELLENAVKYSIDGCTSLSIAVDQEEPRRVTIRISNRASEANITTVSGVLSDLRASGDPFGHYQELMAKSVQLADGSGLGLARVHAEGEMTMSHSVHGDEICIQAHTHIGASAAPALAAGGAP